MDETLMEIHGDCGENNYPKKPSKTDFEYRITVYHNCAIIECPIEVKTFVDIVDVLRKHEGFTLITHTDGNAFKLLRQHEN